MLIIHNDRGRFAHVALKIEEAAGRSVRPASAFMTDAVAKPMRQLSVLLASIRAAVESLRTSEPPPRPQPTHFPEDKRCSSKGRHTYEVAMRTSYRCAVLLFASLFASWACAQPTPKAALLVVCTNAQKLDIVNPNTLQVVAHIPVGNNPHEVIAATDGRTAYVSNYGFGKFHTITEVNLVTQKRVRTIDVWPLLGPHGVDFVDGKLWFTAEDSKAIASYDPTTGKVDWIMGTGQNRTHMIYVFPGAQKIVTTNVNSGTVTIYQKYAVQAGSHLPGIPAGASLPQTGSDWLETVVPSGIRDEGFAVSPDHTQMWTASPVDGHVTIINVNTKKVVGTIDAKAMHANRLAFTPNGKIVLISGGADLVVIDAATHKVIKRIPVTSGGPGLQSNGILVEPDGRRAFVNCFTHNYIAVVDLKTLTVTGRIPVDAGPNGVAWAVRQ